MFRLRGHHLLCLLGYRGMGYSREYVENMTKLHQTLRNEPDSLLLIVNGPDVLCEKFPESGPYHCQDDHISVRDNLVLSRLSLQVGQSISWRELEERIRRSMIPNDISSLCSTCTWRSYGVCEEGISEIQSGLGLRLIRQSTE